MSAPTAYLLTLKDACAAFGVSYTVLYGAVQDGELYAEKAKGKWRVAPEDVRQWLRESDDFQTNGVER